MIRTLVYLLVAIIAAGWIGILVARDPGYVLVAYGGYTLQTSLWVLIVLLTVSVVAVHYAIRLLRGFLRMPGVYEVWRIDRADRKSRRATQQGLALLSAGDYSRAEKLLVNGARNSEAGTNLIAAARAADAQGQPERREALLRQAVESDSGLALPAAVAAAEMAAQRGDWHHCLECLASARNTGLVLGLKKRAMLALGDWEGLRALLPALKKNGDDVVAFEKRIALAELNAPGLDAERRQMVWKRISSRVKQDDDVVLAYVGAAEETAAEAILRDRIKKARSPALLRAYGELGQETLTKRIKRALAWDGEDADVQLALATMYRASGDNDSAMDACRRCLDIRVTPGGQRMMGLLLADAGDLAGSNEYLKRVVLDRDTD